MPINGAPINVEIVNDKVSVLTYIRNLLSTVTSTVTVPHGFLYFVNLLVTSIVSSTLVVLTYIHLNYLTLTAVSGVTVTVRRGISLTKTLVQTVSATVLRAGISFTKYANDRLYYVATKVRTLFHR